MYSVLGFHVGDLFDLFDPPHPDPLPPGEREKIRSGGWTHTVREGRKNQICKANGLPGNFFLGADKIEQQGTGEKQDQ